MTGLFIFALILGGGLLLVSLLSGELGGDADPGNADVGGADGQGDIHGLKLLSLRTASYFLFGFGATGMLVSLLTGGGSPLLAMIAALLVGVASAALVHAAFTYLYRTESGEREGESSFVGLTGRVVIPLGPAGPGKILVQRGDRTYELMARPYESAAAGPDGWTSVVVMDMEQGTALVAPVGALMGGEPQ